MQLSEKQLEELYCVTKEQYDSDPHPRPRKIVRRVREQLKVKGWETLIIVALQIIIPYLLEMWKNRAKMPTVRPDDFGADYDSKLDVEGWLTTADEPAAE